MMKTMHSLLYLVVIFVGLLGHFAQSCPLCVGKPEKGSPAFFADEYYQADDADAGQTPIAKAENQEPVEAQS